MSCAEEFVCSLYGQPKLRDVNEARYKIFCSKGCSTSQLPPCRDALQLYVKQSNYQAAVWRSALFGQPSLPSPHGHGWLVDAVAADRDPAVSIEWIRELTAPQQLLELISCSCKTVSQSRRCSCVSNSLKCTNVSHCSCENLGENDSISDDDGDDDSEGSDAEYV